MEPPQNPTSASPRTSLDLTRAVTVQQHGDAESHFTLFCPALASLVRRRGSHKYVPQRRQLRHIPTNPRVVRYGTVLYSTMIVTTQESAGETIKSDLLFPLTS